MHVEEKKSTNFQSHHHPITTPPRARSFFKYFMKSQAGPSGPRGCLDDSESVSLLALREMHASLLTPEFHLEG